MLMEGSWLSLPSRNYQVCCTLITIKLWHILQWMDALRTQHCIHNITCYITLCRLQQVIIIHMNPISTTKQQNLEFFTAIISNPSQLAVGESLLVNYLLADQMHRSLTLLNLLSPSPPVLALIGNIYPHSVWPHLSQSEKAQTRKYLLEISADLWMQSMAHNNTQSIAHNNTHNSQSMPQTQNMSQTHNNTHNISTSLRVMIKRINDVEGWAQWISEYESVLQQMLSSQFAGTAAFIVEMIRSADDRVSELGRHLLPLAMKGIINGQPQHLIQLIYYCIKPMAILAQADPTTIEQTLLPYLSAIWSLLLLHIKSSPLALRFSLKIITVLAGQYQIECDEAIHHVVEEVGRQVVREYMKWVQSAQEVSASMEEDDDDNHDNHVNWEGILYQLMELTCTLNQASNELSSALQSSLLIAATLLPLPSFSSFAQSTDLYFLTLQQQGERCVRNRALEMLMDIQQSRYKGKKGIMEAMNEYCTTVLEAIRTNSVNGNALLTSMTSFADRYKLTVVGIKHAYVFAESAMYILLSFNTILPASTILTAMSTHIQTQISKPFNITLITALALINTLCSKLQTLQKQMYFQFLSNLISSSAQVDVGVLLAAIRGITAANTGNAAIISTQKGAVPIRLFAQLLSYIGRMDGSQSQTCHLVLSFLLRFLSLQSNIALLLQLIPPSLQLHLYTNYLHDGMTSQALIQVLGIFSHPQLISKVWQGGRHGKGQQQWSKLIGKWISTNKMQLSEMDIYNLVQTYHTKQEQVAAIVLAYLSTHPLPTYEPLLAYLNDYPHSSWLLILLSKGLLQQPELLLIRTASQLIKDITSQHQFECRLILLYWAVLKWNGLAILEREGMIDPLFGKFIRYAELFRGDHLRIMTAHFLFALAAVYPRYCSQIIPVIKLYGEPAPSEWEDEEEDEQEDIIEKMMGGKGFINDQVEKWMVQGFGQLAWDSKGIQQKMSQFK